MVGDMYRQESKEQLKFEDFYTPFGGHLRKNNRWVKLAELIPWEELEDKYERLFLFLLSIYQVFLVRKKRT
jgi:hypothetical protein